MASRGSKTIIVSLFLPYTIDFDLDSLEGDQGPASTGETDAGATATASAAADPGYDYTDQPFVVPVTSGSPSRNHGEDLASALQGGRQQSQSSSGRSTPGLLQPLTKPAPSDSSGPGRQTSFTSADSTNSGSLHSELNKSLQSTLEQGAVPSAMRLKNPLLHRASNYSSLSHPSPALGATAEIGSGSSSIGATANSGSVSSGSALQGSAAAPGVSILGTSPQESMLSTPTGSVPIRRSMNQPPSRASSPPPGSISAARRSNLTAPKSTRSNVQGMSGRRLAHDTEHSWSSSFTGSKSPSGASSPEHKDISSGSSGARSTPDSQSLFELSRQAHSEGVSPFDGSQISLAERLKLSQRRPQQHARRASLRGSLPPNSLNLQSGEDFKSIYDIIPWTVETSPLGNGGLRNAVNTLPADSEEFGKGRVWLGSLGMPGDSLSSTTREKIGRRLRDSHNSIVVWPSDETFDGAYNHYCKQILWPTLHYQVPDNPKSKAYQDHSWGHFVTLNRLFADSIIAHYNRGDIVWVNDYHLLLVPQMVRDAIPQAIIAFFLHVAFPSSEVFRCLAMRDKLLSGVLGSTLIGFQTPEYQRHFAQTCSRILQVEADLDTIETNDRVISTVTRPIGIDLAALGRRLDDPEVRYWIQMLQERYQGKHILISRDKLDPIKGLRPKLLAYEQFLFRYPEFQRNTVLLQVALSTTEYPELQAQLSEIVTRINSRFGDVPTQHTPVILLRQDITFSQYLGLLTIADLLIVTSLREGMNLTSHEYLYCQKDKKSPLVLSEFVGSASLFKNHVFLINPWDSVKTAEAIYKSLSLSNSEKERMYNFNMESITKNDAKHWTIDFLETVKQTYIKQQRRKSFNIPRLQINHHAKQYESSQKRLFFIDYEGTLVHWGSMQNTVLGTLQRPLHILFDLVSDSRNIVYVTSSLTMEELERVFQRIPGIGLIAENGAFIRPACPADSLSYTKNSNDGVSLRKNSWKRLLPEQESSWIAPIRESMTFYSERTPGTYVQAMRSRLVWHYENADDPSYAAWQAAELRNHVNDSFAKLECHCTAQETAVVAEPSNHTKATAAQYAYKIHGGDDDKNSNDASSLTVSSCEIAPLVRPDFVISIGDGRDDEPLFCWTNEIARKKSNILALAVHVGAKTSDAKSYVNGVVGVLSLLQTFCDWSAASKHSK